MSTASSATKAPDLKGSSIASGVEVRLIQGHEALEKHVLKLAASMGIKLVALHIGIGSSQNGIRIKRRMIPHGKHSVSKALTERSERTCAITHLLKDHEVYAPVGIATARMMHGKEKSPLSKKEGILRECIALITMWHLNQLSLMEISEITSRNPAYKAASDSIEEWRRS